MEKTPEVAPATPAATQPTRPTPPAPKREAAIGKSVVIKGDIMSKEDLFFDGKVLGTIEMPSSRLTIGANGKVEAAIKAREVIVLGHVHGDIEAGDRIMIEKEAHLEGNLKSASISIEDGAFFKGSIDIVRPAPVKTTAPAPKPAESQLPAAAKSAAATPVGSGTGVTPVRPKP